LEISQYTQFHRASSFIPTGIALTDFRLCNVISAGSGFKIVARQALTQY
jgi:hypothetical protein